MLEVFKIKPFDLEPVCQSWSPSPRFLGDPKKDPPVDQWLNDIKAGCIARNVPKEYWHSYVFHNLEATLYIIYFPVALNDLWEIRRKQGENHYGFRFMKPYHHLHRLNELKKVMAQVHGGRYRWNWKKFKTAMRNMSCSFFRLFVHLHD
jgi:hypothetical protein